MDGAGSLRPQRPPSGPSFLLMPASSLPVAKRGISGLKYETIPETIGYSNLTLPVRYCTNK